MTFSKHRFSLMGLASLCFILTSCGGKTSKAPAEIAKEAVAQVDGIPHAQLPGTVIPQNSGCRWVFWTGRN